MTALPPFFKHPIKGPCMNNSEENPFLAAFEDPEHVARYAEGPRRFTPGYRDLHKMTSVLLSERTSAEACVLVHGAGGGLELCAFADAHPGWTFVGVDPAKEMLREAERLMGDDAARAVFHHGYINDAPEGPFDAATSLLTLHFLDKDERKKTLSEIRRRLKPGAPFVMVHSSFPQDEETRALWLSRYAAYAVASGADPDLAEQARSAVETVTTMYDPETDVELLHQSGFQRITEFFAAFTWRGWVCYAPAA